MNREDAESKGISDGDLIQVENPIGAVRVIARVTDRCIRGHMNLHQGSWYDPNPIDGVDDGGCANTLMSCIPSRYDCGNSQQFAYVRVKKITNFFG
jgi:anaerobic dimethyl sulfoxide reductase subunit A